MKHGIARGVRAPVHPPHISREERAKVLAMAAKKFPVQLIARTAGLSVVAVEAMLREACA